MMKTEQEWHQSFIVLETDRFLKHIEFGILRMIPEKSYRKRKQKIMESNLLEE